MSISKQIYMRILIPFLPVDFVPVNNFASFFAILQSKSSSTSSMAVTGTSMSTTDTGTSLLPVTVVCILAETTPVWSGKESYFGVIKPWTALMS